MLGREPHTNKTGTPWLWVPTLYFAEGIPYFLVNQISVAMLTKFGVPNGEMALFTSLLYLPWVIKPFWSPVVELIRTKRQWLITMQAIMTGLMMLTILFIPHPSEEQIASQLTDISLFYGVLITFITMAFASATHDIAADGFYMLALSNDKQATMIGWRSVFYRLSNIFSNSVLIALPGIIYDYTAQHGQPDMQKAWQVTMLATGLIFAILTIWHIWNIPTPNADKAPTTTENKNFFSGFGKTFATYFTKPGIGLAIAFMLLYRLPEAFLVKMVTPFLLGNTIQGGLGLTMQEYSIVYGVVGVVFLLLGGILGGYCIAHMGLKRAIWWMALAITLPDLCFVYLSTYLPTSLTTICSAIAIEQAGYGFGFTAYMMYMMYMAEGEYKTSHYAISTGFMALSMMIPGMFAGYLQEALGYVAFFWMIIICCLTTIIVTFFVQRNIPIQYGTKQT